ncbi:FeoA domain-containing protein [Pantoea stewartii subsp. indologenes]|uniref:FeoA domain-containing protein n=1 Tax=Pantoea TaxID=53335 RepID=UPI000D753F3C|nr:MULTISPECIES: FeoA domain-containing protein [Pantoea]MDK2632812.1 FeoA domain-containing protein [Pantoea stewartii subsp. indologenes]MEB6535518.1 FeoA domain-containing protein [Pantoea stewartii]PXV76854.1 ferrous iron transport protein A [Pantoea sp. PNA 03-3]UYK96349.1 FeoA domain-containing protein [Pantoea stewartii]WRH14839.1 iron transporter [Pantoea sp. JZ2]
MKIKTHTTYRVRGYQPSVDPAWRQKLLTMGVLPGTLIDVIRTAPLGDPVHIRTRRLSLAVRQRDLASVLLEEVR